MLTKRVILFMLECLTVCFVGCRQEADTNEIAKLPADTTDREIQEALNLVTNWQAHFDLFHVNRSPFALELSNKIAFGGYCVHSHMTSLLSLDIIICFHSFCYYLLCGA